MGLFSNLFGGKEKPADPKISISFPEGKVVLGKPALLKMTLVAGSEPLSLKYIKGVLEQSTFKPDKQDWKHAHCGKDLHEKKITVKAGDSYEAVFSIVTQPNWTETSDTCYYAGYVIAETIEGKKLETGGRIPAESPPETPEKAPSPQVEDPNNPFDTLKRKREFSTWMERFRAMTEEVRNTPGVHILRLHIAPGLTNAQIDAISKQHDLEVEEPMRSFYRWANGIQFLWVHKNSPRFDTARSQFTEGAMDWDALKGKTRFFDGSLMIRPLELTLSNTPAEAIAASAGKKITYKGTERPMDQFLKNIRVFDSFLNGFDACYIASSTGDPAVALSAENFSDWYRCALTVFDAYLEIVLAVKCVPEGRWKYLANAKAFREGAYSILFSPNTPNKTLSVENLCLSGFFPESTEFRKFYPVSETCVAFNNAQTEPPLSQQELNDILVAHTSWKKSGGFARSWRTISIVQGELRMCSSSGAEGTEGKQAHIQRRRWTDVNTKGIDLSHAGMVDAYAPGIDFSGSNLSNCCFTDSHFEGTIFDGCDLSNVDFSRSILRNASFKGANLTGADFQDTDLRGADFTGALNVTAAIFPGANLKGVRHSFTLR